MTIPTKPDELNLTQEQWAEMPAVLRDEILRAVRELTAGMEKYRPAYERDTALADFHAMAEAGGTTVADALRGYIEIENVLRADPRKGMKILASKMGIDLADVMARALENEPDVLGDERGNILVDEHGNQIQYLRSVQ